MFKEHIPKDHLRSFDDYTDIEKIKEYLNSHGNYEINISLKVGKTIINHIEQLEKEKAELKQQLQGLTPEMIKRFKEAIKHKTICWLCRHLGTVGAEEGACKKSICVNYDKFEFFNDSEGGNE